MKLYDTAQKRLITLTLPDRPIRLYVCGVTPYDAAHMGHIFTFMTYDLLQRRLEDSGHAVQLVRNITDIDEPIFNRAAQNGEHYADLAKRETVAFQKVMRTLGFRLPDAEPLASSYIAEMADAVAVLLQKGHAYRLEDDIYFDVASFPHFGSFSGFPKKLQLAFMADRGGDPKRSGKHQPLDFLLWRGIADRNDPAAWESPVGFGRPGWHIECSIMSSHILGTPLDIHGGGMDLLFPHHECEIAQSESLGSAPFSTYWTHVAPLLYQGEKMSKSLGNLVFAHDLLKQGSPAAMRLALMQYHYRAGGEWRPEVWDSACSLETTLREALTRPRGPDPAVLLAGVRAALDDNLDTPRIISLLRAYADDLLAGNGAHDTAAGGLHGALDLLGVTLRH